MGYYQAVIITFEKPYESPKAYKSFLNHVTRGVERAVGGQVEKPDIKCGNDITITFDIYGNDIYDWNPYLGTKSKTWLDIRKFSQEENCTITFDYSGENVEDAASFRYKNGALISEITTVDIDKYDARLEHANDFIGRLRKKGLVEEAAEADAIYHELLAHMALD